MRERRDELITAGHEVTSRWIDHSSFLDTGDVTREMMNSDPVLASVFALRDYEDLTKSNIFIMFTGDDLSSGGRHTEFGLAITTPSIIGVCVIGPRENVFQCLPTISYWPDWETFAKDLWSSVSLSKAEDFIRGLNL